MKFCMHPPKPPDRAQVESKEVRLPDSGPIPLDDQDVQIPFDKDYIEILHMFGDYENSTFSIHNLLQAGEGYALAPGSWVNHTHVFALGRTLARRKIAETEVQDNSSPMAIYVVSGDEDGERGAVELRMRLLRELPVQTLMLSTAVDSTGCEFNRNRLIALMSAIILEEHPGTTLVTESVTSDELTTFIEKKLGGKHHRFKRGYKNLIEEAIRQNSVGGESHLAIQTSGHGAAKENHRLDDGAYLMVKLLNKLASARASSQTGGSKVLTDLEENTIGSKEVIKILLKKQFVRIMLAGSHTLGFQTSGSWSSKRRNRRLDDGCISMVKLLNKLASARASSQTGGSKVLTDLYLIGVHISFRDNGEAMLKHLVNKSESDPLKKALVKYEGVRISGYGGWFLLRLTLHDLVLPLNIEAPSNEDAVTLALAVLSATNEFSALDVSALAKFVQQELLTFGLLAVPKAIQNTNEQHQATGLFWEVSFLRSRKGKHFRRPVYLEFSLNEYTFELKLDMK
ncbi:phosphoglucomutase isoform X2 [Tanacetum coccineum]